VRSLHIYFSRKMQYLKAFEWRMVPKSGESCPKSNSRKTAKRKGICISKQDLKVVNFEID
jgi:hypothetical protein